MIDIIYDFVRVMNGSKDSHRIPDSVGKVKYINDNLKAVSTNGKSCKELAAVINSKLPGKINITKDGKEVCAQINHMMGTYTDNLRTEHETIKNSYEEQVMYMRNVVDAMKGFIDELEGRISAGKCSYAEKSMIQNNLENISRIQSGLSNLANQIASRYNDEFAQYSNKVNKYIKEGDVPHMIETIRNNPDDDLNKNIVKMIKVLKPIAIVTYYTNKALELAGIDAKKFYSLETEHALNELISNELVKNAKSLNSKKGFDFIKAIQILKRTFPMIQHADLDRNEMVYGGDEMEGGYFNQPEQVFSDLELFEESLDRPNDFMTTQRRLELLREHLKNGKSIKTDTLGFGMVKLIKDVHLNLRTEVLNFVKEVNKQNVIIKPELNSKFVDSITGLDTELSKSGETLISIFTGMKADNRAVLDRSNINNAIKEAIIATKNLGLDKLTTQILDVIETLNILLNEVFPQIHSNNYKVYGGAADSDVIYRDNFDSFKDDLKYYSNVNSLKSSLTQSEGEIVKYSKNQEELNKSIFQNLLRSIDLKIEKFKTELDPNDTLNEGDLAELETYLMDIRDSILNMYKVGESIDHILSEFHKKILMGNMNQSFDNLLKLVENVVSIGDWSINDRIEAINKLFNTKDMLDFSPYLKNALKSINPAYDMSRISSVVAYNLYKESENCFGESKDLTSIKMYKELTRMLYNIATQNKVNVQYQSLIDNILDRDFDQIIDEEQYNDAAVKAYIRAVFTNFRQYAKGNVSELVDNGAQGEPKAYNLRIVGGDPFSMDMILQILVDMVTLRIIPIYRGRAAMGNRLAVAAPAAFPYRNVADNDIRKMTEERDARNYNDDQTRARLVILSDMARGYLEEAGWGQAESEIKYSEDSTKLSKNMRKLSVLRNMFLIFIHIGETIDKQLPNDLEIGSMHSIIFHYIVTSTFVPKIDGLGKLSFGIREYDSSLGNVNSNIVITGGDEDSKIGGGAAKFHEEIDDIKNNAAFLMAGLISSLYDTTHHLFEDGALIVDNAGADQAVNAVMHVRGPVSIAVLAAGAIAGAGSYEARKSMNNFFELLKVDSISNNELRFIMYGVIGLINEKVAYTDIQTLLKTISTLDPASGKYNFNPNYNKIKKIMVDNGAQDNDAYIIKIIGNQASNLMKFIGDVESFVTYCKAHNNRLPQYSDDNHVLPVENLDGNIANLYLPAYHNDSVKAILNILLKSDFSGRKFKDFVEALWHDPLFLTNLLVVNPALSGQRRDADAFDSETKMLLMPDNNDAIQCKNPLLSDSTNLGVIAVREQAALGWPAAVVDAATANANHHTVGGIYDQLVQLKTAHGYDIGFTAEDLKSGNIKYDDVLDLFEYEDEQNIIILGGAKLIMGGNIEQVNYNAKDTVSYKENIVVINKATNTQVIWPAAGSLTVGTQLHDIVQKILDDKKVTNITVEENGGNVQYKDASLGVTAYVDIFNNVDAKDDAVDNASLLANITKLQDFLVSSKSKEFSGLTSDALRKYFYASLILGGVLPFDKINTVITNNRVLIEFKPYTNAGTKKAILEAANVDIDAYEPTGVYSVTDLGKCQPALIAAAVNCKSLTKFARGPAAAPAVDELPVAYSLMESQLNFYTATHYANSLISHKKSKTTNPILQKTSSIKKIQMFKIKSIQADSTLGADTDFDITNINQHILSRAKLFLNNDAFYQGNNVANVRAGIVGLAIDAASQKYYSTRDNILRSLPVETTIFNNENSINKISPIKETRNFKADISILNNDHNNSVLAEFLGNVSPSIYEELYNLVNLPVDLAAGYGGGGAKGLKLNFGAVGDLGGLGLFAPDGVTAITANNHVTNMGLYGNYEALLAAAPAAYAAVLTSLADINADLKLKDVILLNGLFLNMTVFGKKDLSVFYSPLPDGVAGSFEHAKLCVYRDNVIGTSTPTIEAPFISPSIEGLQQFISLFMFGYYLPVINTKTNENPLFIGHPESGIFNIYNDNVTQQMYSCSNHAHLDNLEAMFNNHNLADIINGMFLTNGTTMFQNMMINGPIVNLKIDDNSAAKQTLYYYITKRIKNTFDILFDTGLGKNAFASILLNNATTVLKVNVKPELSGTADYSVGAAAFSAKINALYTGAPAPVIDDPLEINDYSKIFGIDWVEIAKNSASGLAAGAGSAIITNCIKNICDKIIDEAGKLFASYYVNNSSVLFGLWTTPAGNNNVDITTSVEFEKFQLKQNSILPMLSNIKLFNIAHNKTTLLRTLKNLSQTGELQYSAYPNTTNKSNTNSVDVNSFDPTNAGNISKLAFKYNNSLQKASEIVDTDNGVIYYNHLVAINEIVDNLNCWLAVFRHKNTLENFIKLYKFTIGNDELKTYIHDNKNSLLPAIRNIMINNGTINWNRVKTAGGAAAVAAALVVEQTRIKPIVESKNNLLVDKPKTPVAAGVIDTYMDVHACRGRFYDKLYFRTGESYAEFNEPTLTPLMRAHFLKAIIQSIHDQGNATTKIFCTKLLDDLNDIDNPVNEHKVRRCLIFLAVLCPSYDVAYYNLLHDCQAQLAALLKDNLFTSSIKNIYNYILKPNGKYRDCYARFVGEKMRKTLGFFDVKEFASANNIVLSGNAANYYANGVSSIINEKDLKGLFTELQISGDQAKKVLEISQSPVIESLVSNWEPQTSVELSNEYISECLTDIMDGQSLPEEAIVKYEIPSISLSGLNPGIADLVSKNDDIKYLYRQIKTLRFPSSDFDKILNNAAGQLNNNAGKVVNLLKYVYLNSSVRDLTYDEKTIIEYFKKNSRDYEKLNLAISNSSPITGGNIYGGSRTNQKNGTELVSDYTLAIFNDIKIDTRVKTDTARKEVLPSGIRIFGKEVGQQTLRNNYKKTMFDLIMETGWSINDLMPNNADVYNTIRRNNAANVNQKITSDMEALNANHIRIRIDRITNHGANWAALIPAVGVNDSIWLDPGTLNAANLSIFGHLMQTSYNPAANNTAKSNKLENMLLYLNLATRIIAGPSLEVTSLCKNLREFVNMYPIPTVHHIEQLKFIIEKNGHKYIPLGVEPAFTDETFKILNNVIKFMNASFYNKLYSLIKLGNNTGLVDIAGGDIDEAGVIGVHSIQYYNDVISQMKNLKHIYENNFILNYVIAVGAYNLAPGAGFNAVTNDNYENSKNNLNKIINNNDLVAFKNYFTPGVVPGAVILANATAVDAQHDGLMTLFKNSFHTNKTPFPIFTHGGRKNASIENPKSMYGLHLIAKYAGNPKVVYGLHFEQFQKYSLLADHGKYDLLGKTSEYSRFLSNQFKDREAVNMNHKNEINDYRRNIDKAIRNKINSYSFNDSVDLVNKIGIMLSSIPIKSVKYDKSLLRNYYNKSLGLNTFDTTLDRINYRFNGLLYDYKMAQREMLNIADKRLMKPFSIRSVLKAIDDGVYKYTGPAAGGCKIDANYIRFVFMLQLSRTAYLLANSPAVINEKYIRNFCDTFDRAIAISKASVVIPSVHTYNAGYDEQAPGGGTAYGILAADAQLTVGVLLRSGIGSLKDILTQKLFKYMNFYADDCIAALNGGVLLANNGGLDFAAANQFPNGAGGLYTAIQLNNRSHIINNPPFDADAPLTVEPSLKHLLFAFAKQSTTQNIIMGGGFPSPNGNVFKTLTNDDIARVIELYELSKNISENNINDFIKAFIKFSNDSNLVSIINKEQLLASLLCRHEKGNVNKPNYHIAGERGSVYSSNLVRRVYQASLNEFTSSHALNDALFNTDSLFVNIIKAINARIFEALGLYDLYNRRGIYENDSGRFLNHKTRMLIGAGNDEVNPLIADVYIRLPLLGLFYKDLFEKSGVANYKFGIVPDNTGIYGPFIEFMFIKLDDNVKSLRNLTNDDVYNIVVLCNNIFNSVKNVDNIYKEFIGEINRRYGYMSSRMYDSIKEELRDEMKIRSYGELSRDTVNPGFKASTMKLPGEGKIPTYSTRNYNKLYDLFTFSDKEKVNISTIKDTIENFRRSLDRKLTEQIETSTFKLTPFINNFKSNLVNAKGDKVGELKEFYNKIDHYTEKALSPTEVLFTEFVRSGIELIEHNIMAVHNLFVNSFSMVNFRKRTFNPREIEDGPVGIIYSEMARLYIKTIMDDPGVVAADYRTALDTVIGARFDRIFTGDKANKVAAFKARLNGISLIYEAPGAPGGVPAVYGTLAGKRTAVSAIQRILNEELIRIDEMPLFLYGNQFIPYDKISNIQLDFRVLKNKVKELLDYVISMKGKFYNSIDTAALTFYDLKITKLIQKFKEAFIDDVEDSICKKLNVNLGLFNLNLHLTSGTFIIHKSLPYEEVGFKFRITNGNAGTGVREGVSSRIIITNFNDLTMLTPIQMYNTLLCGLFNNFGDLNGNYYYKGLIDAIRSKEINDAIASPDGSTIDDDLSNPDQIFNAKNIVSRFIADKLNDMLNPEKQNLFKAADRPNANNLVLVLDNMANISEVTKTKMSAMLPSYISLFNVLITNASKVIDLINANYSNLEDDKKALADTILVINNKVVRAARFTADNLVALYKELGSQTNTYMEPYDGFNEEYEQRFHQPHIAPITFMLYSNGYTSKVINGRRYETTLDNVDKVYPINNKIKNYKFLNAMKIIFSDNLPNASLFGWDKMIVSKFNEANQSNQISDEDMLAYIRVFVDLCKNQYNMVTSALIQGRNNITFQTAEDRNPSGNYIDRIKASLDIDQMLTVLENDDSSGYERLKELFRFSFKAQPEEMKFKNQSIVANLVELGIPPINLNEMMKEIPLATLFNAVYNFDKFIERNVDFVLKERYSEEFIQDFKLYLKNPLLFDKEEASKFNDLSLGEMNAKLLVDSAPTSSLSITLNYIYNIYKLTIVTIQQKMRQRISEKNRMLKGPEVFL